MDCSICLCPIQDDDATSKTECNHIFHSKCIFSSIAHKNFSCPNCRKVLAEGPSNSKESETDDIIRSIIEIHSIPNFTSDLPLQPTTTEQTISQHYQDRVASQILGENLESGQSNSQNYQDRIASQILSENLVSEMIQRVINNEEQVMTLDRNIHLYRPRTIFPPVNENANLGSNINVARTTQRFRQLLPINMRSSNTDFNRDQSGDYSPNTANRSIITAPSRPRSILVRSLINRNEDTTVESTENQG